jgi:MraZ protein
LAADRPGFSGDVEHNLDDKGRLVVPARFRERLGAGFFLSIIHPDKCLALFPAWAWAELCDRLDKDPNKDAAFRSFERFLFAHTDELSCDAQGRLLIPVKLRSYANIEKDVVSLGLRTRIEIWARERYVQQSPDGGAAPDYVPQNLYA